jgi:hypothetical protein
MPHNDYSPALQFAYACRHDRYGTATCIRKSCFCDTYADIETRLKSIAVRHKIVGYGTESEIISDRATRPFEGCGFDKLVPAHKYGRLSIMTEQEILLVMTIMTLLDKPVSVQQICDIYVRQKQILAETCNAVESARNRSVYQQKGVRIIGMETDESQSV